MPNENPNNVPDDETTDETPEGEYNPSGDIPSHPADPKFGDDETTDDKPA